MCLQQQPELIHPATFPPPSSSRGLRLGAAKIPTARGGTQGYSFTLKGISRGRSFQLCGVFKNEQTKSPGEEAYTTESAAASNYTQIRRLISQQSACQRIKPFKTTAINLTEQNKKAFCFFWGVCFIFSHILYKGKNAAELQA